MKDIYKSALWALTSIPITMFGVSAGFAIAHGEYPFMLILLGPGLIILWLLGQENYPDWLLGTIGFTAQYISYFLVIHGAKKLFKLYKKRKQIRT